MPKSKGSHTKEVVALRKETGRRIRGGLANRGMKPVDLARAVGVGASTVNSWLTGKAFPGVENLVRVSLTLLESVSFLVPSGFTSRDSMEKKGEALGVKLGPRLLDRLLLELETQEQRVRRELHGLLGELDDEKAGLEPVRKPHARP